MKYLPKIIISATAIFVGCMVLSLSVPRMMAAFSLLTTDPIRKRIAKKKPIAREKLLERYSAVNTALAWGASGRRYAARSIWESIIAKTYPRKSKEQAKWMNDSMLSMEKSLLRSPSEPSYWLRLTFLGLINGGEKETASRALTLSILTGPYERGLVLRRVRYGLFLWPNLNEEEREVIRRQIVWSYSFAPNKLISLARRVKMYKIIIQNSLTRRPKQYRHFIKNYNKRIRSKKI